MVSDERPGLASRPSGLVRGPVVSMLTPLEIEVGDQLELFASLTIFVLATVLATLSFIAWRRERDQRMALVMVAYGFFVLRGLFVFLEEPLETVVGTELLAHGASFLVVFGLLVFFFAVSRD